jgi:hypothetical protein
MANPYRGCAYLGFAILGTFTLGGCGRGNPGTPVQDGG